MDQKNFEHTKLCGQLQADLDTANAYIESRQSTSEYDEGYSNGQKAMQAEKERLWCFIQEWKDVLLTNMTEEDFEQALKGK